jgi:2-isopropylmalate synthase
MTEQKQDIVKIFDTTLRDGEQSPGASLNTAEKIEIARSLEQLNVDIIEAGFPISSPGDFEAVQAVSEIVKNCTVAGLARSMQKDIEAAAAALKKAVRPRIHVFCATSDIHLKYKFKRAKEEILKMSVDAVKLARGLVAEVEFSPEDASRTEPGFLAEVVSAVIEAGACAVNIPDTVGYAVPDHFSWIISMLREKVPNINQAVISVHCHNDLGLAVANSLAAVKAGARQVECTINGLGERAGNCSLEEFVMALKVRNDHYHLKTQINTTRLYPISRQVASLTGISVQRNKAIVGENAFAHEAGIHQHGVLAEASTYEIMKPDDIGIPASKLVLGKHSGRHAFRERIEHLGYHVSDEQLDKAFEQFKILADKKKEIFDEDLEAIVEELASAEPSVWELVALQTTAGTSVMPTATIKLRSPDGQVFQDAATGDGPIDAVYSTIQRICNVSVELADYQIRAITGGKEAQGEVNLEIKTDGRSIRGRAVSTDIIEASAKAYLAAINRYLARHKS